jgi:hypothetical protein
MDKAALYQQALRVWDYDQQLCRLGEKASELAAESCRMLNHQSPERRLASVMADVEIIIEQFRHNGLAGLIDYQKQQTLERLAQRMGGTYVAQ